jgi:hypothetical protein
LGYLYENFEYRTYYIQAELTDGSVYFGQYLPTYHLSSLFWQCATLVIPNPTSNIQIIIKNGHAYLSVDNLNPVDISGVGEIYPNPVTNNALIRISSIVEAKVQLNIINQLGQTITTKKLILNQGINQVELNTSGLPGGLYNLRIITENNSMILKRFIKY